MEDYYFYGENKQYIKNSDVDNFYFVDENTRCKESSYFNNNHTIQDVFKSLNKILSFENKQ